MKENDNSSSDEEEQNLKSSENINTNTDINTNQIQPQIPSNENKINFHDKEIELQQLDGQEQAIIRDPSAEAKKKRSKRKNKRNS